MRRGVAPKFDCASEHIIQLQGLQKRLPAEHKGVEMGLLQQYLDEESLYIKQIPKVPTSSLRTRTPPTPFEPLQIVCRCFRANIKRWCRRTYKHCAKLAT